MTDTVSETEISFEVWQEGDMVAASDSLADAEHFMLVYGQDGPVEAKTAITTRVPGLNVVTAMLAASPQGEGLTVDALAQEIRRVDGDNTLGAGALAGALMPFLTSPQGEGSSADVKPTDGDLWWNPDNYEDGFLHWADAFENANEDGADYSVELHRARKLPPVWGALVWIDGEQKIKIFATEAEADDVRVTEGVKP